MKLRRWHRIGIVMSVLWIMYAAYVERSSQMDRGGQHAATMYRLCLDAKQQSSTECAEEHSRLFREGLQPNWEMVAFNAFAPVLAGWLFVGLGLFVFRWIMSGDR
jgi:hypothetical protein